MSGRKYPWVQIKRAPLSQHLTNGTATDVERAQAVSHIGCSGVNAVKIQQQPSNDVFLAAGFAEQQIFIRAKPDEMPVTNGDKAIIFRQRLAACLCGDACQNGGIAANVQLAQMFALYNERPGLSPPGWLVVELLRPGSALRPGRLDCVLVLAIDALSIRIEENRLDHLGFDNVAIQHRQIDRAANQAASALQHRHCDGGRDIRRKVG